MIVVRYRILCLRLLALFSLGLFDTVYSQADDILCSKCVDPDGIPCNDVIRRFSSSKFWVVKGDTKGTFDNAVETCEALGFTIAEINSEEEQSTFGKLEAYGKRYWIGFIKQKADSEWTKMDLRIKLSFRPSKIEGDINVGPRAISVDTNGIWYSSSVNEKFRIVCQFSVTSSCYRGTGEKETLVEAAIDLDCPEPAFQDNQLIRTGPKSKFLFPKRSFFTSSIKASALCNNLGLEPAIIDEGWEYKHLVNFVHDMSLNNTRTNFKVNLGAVKSGSGMYENRNRMLASTRIKFQAFKLQDREYFEDGSDCLAVEWYRNYHYFVPVSCDKPSEIMPLCQYKEGQCLTSHPQSIQDEDSDLNELFKVGESETHVFYGAMRQKTWLDAEHICEAMNLKLIGFQRQKPELLREMIHVINKYRKSLGIDAWSGLSWTSGRLRNSNEFIFDSDNEQWNIHENHTKAGTSDPSKLNRKGESCLIVTYNGIRPVLCELPNFFICYGPIDEVPKTNVDPPLREIRQSHVVTENQVATTDTERGTHIIEKRDGNEVCESTDRFKVSFTPGGLTKEEVINLITISIKLKFTENLSSGLRTEINETSHWRIPHVEEMANLTKHLCPEENVSPTFINVLSNFLMVYYNSIEEMELPPKRVNFWKELEEMYSECQSASQPLTFTTSGGLITEYGEDIGSGIVNIVNEKADNYPVLDYIVEGLWYMFELTAATCYKSAGSTITWFSDYFIFFRKDFTDPLKKWWVDPGQTNYGLIFGDIDLYESLYNLRACSVATFQRLDIQDLLLVRPVEIKSDGGEHLEATLNERI